MHSTDDNLKKRDLFGHAIRGNLPEETIEKKSEV
jgi:hypothetical protein